MSVWRGPGALAGGTGHVCRARAESLDTAWAEETLGQLMSSSSHPGTIHYVGVTCRQNGIQARLLEDLKSVYDAGIQRSAGGIRFSRLLQAVLQCCKLTGPEEVAYADSDGLLVLSCKTLMFQDEKKLKHEVPFNDESGRHSNRRPCDVSARAD